MSSHHHLTTVTAIGFDMLEHPCHRLGCIIERLGHRHLWQQPVVDADNHQTLLLQTGRNLLTASLQSSTMEPDNHRTAVLPFGIIDVQLQPFHGIRVGLCRIADVVHLLIALCPCIESKHEHQGYCQ